MYTLLTLKLSSKLKRELLSHKAPLPIRGCSSSCPYEVGSFGMENQQCPVGRPVTSSVRYPLRNGTFTSFSPQWWAALASGFSPCDPLADSLRWNGYHSYFEGFNRYSRTFV